MPNISRFRVLVVLSAVAVTVTACGGDSGTNEATAATTEASTETTSATSAPPPSDIAVTPGGTGLKFGQQAVIPYDDSIETGTLGIIVTSVDAGDQAGFEQKFGADAEGSVPGETNTGVFLIGDVPDCEKVLSPKDFTTAGATFESCQLVAAPTGQPIVEVGYDKLDYDENPVVWTK